MGYATLYAKAVKKQALKPLEKPVEDISLRELTKKENLLQRALEEVDKIYVSGLYDYLLSSREDPYKQLMGLEAQVGKAYLDSTVTVGELRATLREYWTKYFEAVRAYEYSLQSKQGNPNKQDKHDKPDKHRELNLCG